MCEFVVMITSTVNPAYVNYDILEIREDGWPWSAVELSNRNWQIVKVPGIPASDYYHICDPIVTIGSDGLANGFVAPCSHMIPSAHLPAGVPGPPVTAPQSVMSFITKKAGAITVRIRTP